MIPAAIPEDATLLSEKEAAEAVRLLVEKSQPLKIHPAVRTFGNAMGFLHGFYLWFPTACQQENEFPHIVILWLWNLSVTFCTDTFFDVQKKSQNLQWRSQALRKFVKKNRYQT